MAKCMVNLMEYFFNIYGSMIYLIESLFSLEFEMSMTQQNDTSITTRCEDMEHCFDPDSNGLCLHKTSLVNCTAIKVAKSADIEFLSAHYDLLPISIRLVLLQHLSSYRFRALEMEMELQINQEILFSIKEEFSNEWLRRCEQLNLPHTPLHHARQKFWEAHVQDQLRSPTGQLDPLHLPLFANLIHTLKLNSRDLSSEKTQWFFHFSHLLRLDFHHPTPKGWSHFLSIIQQRSSVEEIGFYHGKLTAENLYEITHILQQRSGTVIKSFTFASVKFQSSKNLQALQVLLQQSPTLQSLRLSNCLPESISSLFFQIIFQLSTLSSLSLEHNEMEDDVLQDGIPTSLSTSLEHVDFSHNALSMQSLQALVKANGNLKRLDLHHNTECRVSGARALVPLLSTLITLDLSTCEIRYEGMKTILSAVTSNHSLESLNLNENYAGHEISSVLATCLRQNQTLQHLSLNGIGLTATGCTPDLIQALEMNTSVVRLGFAANRLRNEGCLCLFQALVTRSRKKAYESVDFSGNLLTVDVLEALMEVLVPLKASKRPRLELSSPQIHCLNVMNNDLSMELLRSQKSLQNLRQHIDQVQSNEWITVQPVFR